MVEEKLLIFRFRRGSPQALRQIYDRYKVEMLKLATILLGDGNTAEDIVHAVIHGFAWDVSVHTGEGAAEAVSSIACVRMGRGLGPGPFQFRASRRRPSAGSSGVAR
jgi:hypothetical protein